MPQTVDRDPTRRCRTAVTALATHGNVPSGLVGEFAELFQGGAVRNVPLSIAPGARAHIDTFQFFHRK
jgi:hypothetical protein